MVNHRIQARSTTAKFAALSPLTEFENFTVLGPGGYNLVALDSLLGLGRRLERRLAPLRQSTATTAH